MVALLLKKRGKLPFDPVSNGQNSTGTRDRVLSFCGINISVERQVASTVPLPANANETNVVVVVDRDRDLLGRQALREPNGLDLDLRAQLGPRPVASMSHQVPY